MEDDPDPLAIHHMVLDIVVSFPTLEITEADVVMETHPHRECPKITDHYKSLVGLSIARGFTHRIRELFGGPRGCTHTTALLQAMAPVAVQSIWSMRVSGMDGTPVAAPLPTNPTDEQVREHFAYNINTCHVWDENGAIIAGIKQGKEFGPPLWITQRLEELGLDESAWKRPFPD